MIKVIKIIAIIVLVVASLCVILVFTGNSYLIKAVANTYLKGVSGPTITESDIFENRTVEAGNWRKWPNSVFYNQKKLSKEELKIQEKYETVSFLVIKNDSIRFEQYWEDFNPDTKSNTFSVAKSFISILIGAAIKDGSIKSVDQKVGDFIPEYKKGDKAKISIKNLLQMSSGIDFGESYGDPFGFMAKAYYGDEIYKLTVSKEVKYEPGKYYLYQGGNTLLLSFIINKATGKTVSEYFSEKVWKPIGAKNDALWNLDEKDGREKAYCCFYSNARDFAKIGQLYLQKGNWNGQQIVSENYWKESLSPVNITDKSGSIIDYYGYQWWMTNRNEKQVFYARGIYGQYIAWIPAEEIVFVRLGRKRADKKDNSVPEDFNNYIDMALRIGK